MDDDALLITGRELARLFHVSRRTVEAWRYRKSGPPYIRLSNGVVRYYRDEALDYLEQYRVKQSSKADGV